MSRFCDTQHNTHGIYIWWSPSALTRLVDEIQDLKMAAAFQKQEQVVQLSYAGIVQKLSLHVDLA